MKKVSWKSLRHAMGFLCFLAVFMMMSTVAKAAEPDLAVGVAEDEIILLEVEGPEEENTEQAVAEVPVVENAGNADAEATVVEETVVQTAADAVAETAEETAVEENVQVTEMETGEPQKLNLEPVVQYVMANVDNSVNVREEPNEEAPVAGKLYKDCSGTVLETGDGWTKIESGNLTGWVSNDYLIFGEEAETRMQEVGSLKATITTDSLRVRKEPTEDAGVYKLVKTGEVMDAVEELDGWIAVQVDEETVGYVSADYATVEFATDHGKTIKEIEDEERAKELAKLTQNRGAIPTSVSDVMLLAALIQAEAGGQPYEGKLAVGAVVMNRVRSGGYPNTIIGVITAPGQFPPATNGKVAGILARGPSSSCIQAAEAAVAGQTTVGGATHFNRVGSHAGGVVIGNHVFW